MANNRKQDLTPLIMWFVLFGGIIAVSLFRPIRLVGAGHELPVWGDLVFIGLYLLWMDTLSLPRPENVCSLRFGRGSALPVEIGRPKRQSGFSPPMRSKRQRLILEPILIVGLIIFAGFVFGEIR